MPPITGLGVSDGVVVGQVDTITDPSLYDDFYGGVDPTGGAFVPAPGGFTSSDGINAVAPSGNNNPNPTGRWMTTAQAVIQSATKALSTYVSGSPSAATPPALRPGVSPKPSVAITTAAGKNNFLLIGGVVVAAVRSEEHTSELQSLTNLVC